MNQDQVKNKLLQLDGTVEDFTVTFSGKTSKKVDGLYKPEEREIIIHNHNFEGDDPLMYTAIHEFAHHIHFTRHAATSARSHAGPFWNILHRLLFLAEEKGLYRNVFHHEPRFRDLTGRIKEQFLSVNGRLMQEFGKLLMEAHDLCREFNASFHDYADRVLGLHRSAAGTVMRVGSLDINPEIGYENMKTVASIKDPLMRKKAEAAFLEGQTPDMVREDFVSRTHTEESIPRLEAEKKRIEKNLELLTVRLADIERKIDELKSKK